MSEKRDYIINELLEKDFVQWETKVIHLEETEETGKSQLRLEFTSEENSCINRYKWRVMEIMC